MATPGLVFGGIETGGTKIVAALGTGPDDLRTAAFPTSSPGAMVEACRDFFRKPGVPPVAAVGVASFGPLDLDPTSATYGYVTRTPKPGWQQFDLIGALRQALGRPLGFDTDVNAAALGEGRWGAARGLQHYLYVTVGTGVGGGAVVDGAVLHGMLHPEMGHIRIPHDRAADPFPGCCPYHGDCLEGLASGTAMAARWGCAPCDLAADHPGWDLEARYLALALVSWICTLSPQRIIIGGGLMEQPGLLARVREDVQALLGGYLEAPAFGRDIGQYVVQPGLGSRSGVLGALLLGMDADRRDVAQAG